MSRLDYLWPIKCHCNKIWRTNRQFLTIDESYKLRFETVRKFCFSVPLSFYCWAKERKGGVVELSLERWHSGSGSRSVISGAYTKRKRGGAPDISKWIAKQSSLANVLRVWMRVCVRVCVCESVSRKRESGSCVIGQLRPDRSLTPSRHRDRILHPGQLSHKLLMHEALSFCWRCATVGWWELWVLEGAG